MSRRPTIKPYWSMAIVAGILMGSLFTSFLLPAHGGQGPIALIRPDQLAPEARIPVGTVIMFGGLRPPEGWLLCDGTAVSRSTYGRLFSVIGTAYGPGDGSTTFGLPDLRGRIPAGLDGTQEEFNSLGKKGGEKAHTLTMEEIPSHQHSVYPHAGFLGGGKEGAGGADPGTRVHDSITGPAGGGTAHNNLQPYQTIQFIIRY